MAKPPKRSQTPARRGGAKWKRIAWWTAIGGFAVAMVGVIALAIAVYSTRASLPSYDELKSSPNGQMIRVHAVDGTVLVSLGPSYGEWIRSDQIPQVMKDAIIATEDRRFESHWGIDPIGIARGIRDSVDRKGRVSAVSTITQQLARNVFLSLKRSYGRKAREAVLALALERKFSRTRSSNSI